MGVFCLGYDRAPLPRLISIGGHRLPDINSHSQPGGGLIDSTGFLSRGLYGVGMAFADDEWTSGKKYAAAGFNPFARRAAEIAEQVAEQIRQKRRSHDDGSDDDIKQKK